MDSSNHEDRNSALPIPPDGDAQPARRPPPLPSQPAVGENGAMDASMLRPPPPPDISSAQEFALDELHAEFLTRARFVIAEQRGFTPKCEAMLESIAAEMGLDASQAALLLDKLRRPPPRADQPPSEASGATPTDGEPTAPPKQTDSLQFRFRAYVFEALSASSRDVVRESKEQRLVEEGVGKLGLSPALARQIVRQVAQDVGKDVLSLKATATVSEDTADERQPQFDSFLLRAKAILAEQRGINARSRVLLAAAAREVGLSEEQADQAIASLQTSGKGTKDVEAWYLERLDSFREFLQAEVARLTHRVVTSRVRQKWLDDADQRHGIEQNDAKRIIRDVLAYHEVRVVSEDQAREFIGALVADLLDDAVVLDDDVRIRVFAEGSQWGLSPMQVDGIVRDRICENRRRSSFLRRLVRYSLFGGVGTICILAGGLIWALTRPDADGHAIDPVVKVGEPTDANAPPTAPEGKSPPKPGWWSLDESVLIAITKFRRVIPEQLDLLDGICQQDSNARSLAYRELVAAGAASTDNLIHEALYQELIIACHAGDPSEECAGVLRECLLSLIPTPDDALPAEEDVFDAPFWVMRTLVVAFISPTTSPDRVDRLARDAATRLGSPIDLTQEATQIERQCAGALYQHLYQVVTANVSRDPLLAVELITVLDRQAPRFLTQVEMDDLRLKFLAAAIPMVGDNWRDLTGLLESVVRSPNPLTVLKAVEFMEQAGPSQLATYLAERLQARAGLVANARSIEEAASRVREFFGAKQVVTGSARWRELDERIADRRGEPLAKADEATALLQQAVEYAQLNAMACALVQGETGYAAFDELAERSRIALTASPLSQPGTNRRRNQPAADMQRQNVLRYIQYLMDPRRQPSHRAVYLRSLASFASGVDELERDEGVKLAQYLMKPKPDDEHRVVMEHIQVLGRWQSVRLALADEVLETQIQRERLQPMIEAALGRSLIVDDEDSWKERLYEALLQSVMEDLEFAASRNADDERVYDQARDALRELYASQARALGVAQAEYAAADTPAKLLKLLLEAARTRLPPQDPAAKEFLDRGPYELEALAALSDDDLQWTAALQRAWAKSLALIVASKRPDRAAEADQIIDSLTQPAASPANVLVQLRDGELALLDLWLLMREPN